MHQPLTFLLSISEIAKLLLRKIDRLTNEPNNSRNTPLHCTILMGNLKFVTLLMDKGASTNLLNLDGFSALHITASLVGHLNIFRELIQHSNYRNIMSGPRNNTNRSLHPTNATATASANVAKQSLVNDVTCKNVLHVPIEYKKYNIVEYILKKPKLWSLIDQVDGDRNSTLHFAALQCDPTVIRLLLGNKKRK